MYYGRCLTEAVLSVPRMYRAKGRFLVYVRDSQVSVSMSLFRNVRDAVLIKVRA